MLHAPIYKDIGEYTEKVVGKLSARTLACVAAGVATSFAAAAVCHFAIGIDVADAALPVMAASMPFWLLGFWRPKGLKAEEYLPMRFAHWLEDDVLVYEPGCSAQEIAGSVKSSKTNRRARRVAKRKGAERRAPSEESKED